MKISKLFHWLYAILMLLPFLVFIPNAFYYGFNKEAVAQEKTEQVPVYYETNNPTSNTEIVAGNIYIWNDNYTIPSGITGYYRLMDLEFNTLVNEFTRWNIGPTTMYLSDAQGNSSTILQRSFIFIPSNVNVNVLPSDLYEHISSTDYKKVKEYQPLTTDMSITDSMSYAWDSVWQNDLFSWSYGSFLTEPFIYIGNVFNVPVDNSLYYALSYWLDISIIWLCFDMVMYIPLLVHRWLDKGIIE